MEPETPPSVMPGTKTSLPDRGPAPGAQTGNNSNAAKPSNTTPQKDTGDKDRGNAFHDHVAEYFKAKDCRSTTVRRVDEVVDEAVAGAKGANPDY